MKKTALCERLDIEYPIIQGGMAWITGAELAAAVSNAGGLGVLRADAGAAPDDDMVENLKRLVKETKRLTRKPFGVNLGVPELYAARAIDLCLEEGVPVIVTTAGSAQVFTRGIKEAGGKVLHLVFSVKHAQAAEQEGVDAVIASGFDGGGTLSPLELTTMVLVPQVVDAIKIPVVAAGGIADARGMLAAFALGAQGVQLGTRFIATRECLAHPKFKDAILKAGDSDNQIIRRRKMPNRALKNKLVQRIDKMREAGASIDEILAFAGEGRVRLGVYEGDLEEGLLLCGAASGLIHDIPSAGEVVRRLIEEYDKVVAGLP